MHHPEFPVVSFLVVPLLLSSLPSHIKARSIATIALLAWLVVLNVIRGINSLIWANNTVVHAEVWCDISTKIVIGFTFAVPLSALCICRHLENVSSNRQAVITEADKCRRMRFEALMCFGLPILFMALHYIVQGHRFDLIEDVGCYPSTYFSVPAVIIVWVPPLVISLASLSYAVAAFHHVLQRRIEFAAILQRSNSAITPGRYFRLMALAVFEILWDSGTNIYILYYNTFTGLRPWISWQNVHSNFSRVAIFPRIFLPSWAITQLIWQWWVIPISSIAFFVFFGFGQEAMSDYRGAITWLRRTILCKSFKPVLDVTVSVLPMHRSTTHSLNVTLPSSGSISGPQKRSWDELSLKIPDLVHDTPSPPSVSSSFGGLHSSFPRKDQSHPEFFSSTNQRASPISLSQSEQSISSMAPDPECSLSSSYPEYRVSSTLSDVDLTLRIPPPLRGTPAVSPANPGSPSQDYEIYVSQAYPSSVESLSRYHTATSSSKDPAHPSDGGTSLDGL